jgi:hypothetical protein
MQGQREEAALAEARHLTGCHMAPVVAQTMIDVHADRALRRQQAERHREARGERVLHSVFVQRPATAPAARRASTSRAAYATRPKVIETSAMPVPPDNGWMSVPSHLGPPALDW